jgi:hypothetical protein
VEVKLNLNKSFLRLQLILGIGVRELLENCGKMEIKLSKMGKVGTQEQRSISDSK